MQAIFLFVFLVAGFFIANPPTTDSVVAKREYKKIHHVFPTKDSSSVVKK